MLSLVKKNDWFDSFFNFPSFFNYPVVQEWKKNLIGFVDKGECFELQVPYPKDFVKVSIKDDLLVIRCNQKEENYESTLCYKVTIPDNSRVGDLLAVGHDDYVLITIPKEKIDEQFIEIQ